VALVKTDVSEERSASIIRMTKIGELGTTLAVTSNLRILFLRSVRRVLVTADDPISPSCHRDDGGAVVLRNVGSYRSHTS
jgi:hypothetical protein